MYVCNNSYWNKQRARKTGEMERNEDLRMAWDFVEKTGTNIFLTGKAGTGKTTFLRELREKSPKRMVVLAPTGIAAINAGGMTIHSFFQLPLSPYVPGASFAGKEQKRFQFSKVKRGIIKTLDLLVIDEISMVRANLLDAVDSVMRRYRVHDKPFGGVQLLLIGDLQQLAPVVKDGEWDMLKNYYDTPYFFSSKALNMTPYQTIELKKVYRQQDDSFIALLNKIRDNRADDATFNALNNRYIAGFTPPKGSDYIRLTTHNYQADRINDEQLSRLGGREYHYRAKVDGVFPETSYPADEILTLKEGAQVMFIKNDTDREYYNGMIGEVSYADEKTVKVMSRDTGDEIELKPAEWANAKYILNEQTKEIEETVEGVFRQFPLRLAWAITIHKSQGLTFEHAIIDASRSFAHGQTYVALSRCKSLEGLVLSAPLSRSALISDNTVDSFIEQTQQNKPTEGMLNAMQKMYVIQILNELFNFSALKQATEMLLRTLSEHFYNKYTDLHTAYTDALKRIDGMMDVARKFETQYTNIVGSNPDVDSDQLQERIHKAAQYFLLQIAPMGELLSKTTVETGNKAVRAQFDDRLAQLADEVKLKSQLLKYESEESTCFSTKDYLHTKACILLGEALPAKSKKAKKTKEPKPKRIPTKDVSFEMFQRGMTIKEIALERNLAFSTVFSHLSQFVENGVLQLSDIVPQQHIDAITDYVRTHPKYQNATEIKNALDGSITYYEIMLVAKLLEL